MAIIILFFRGGGRRGAAKAAEEQFCFRPGFESRQGIGFENVFEGKKFGPKCCLVKKIFFTYVLKRKITSHDSQPAKIIYFEAACV